MKKYLLLITSAFLVLFSCQQSKKTNEAIAYNVVEAENLVRKHDSIIQKSLDDKRYTDIPDLTQITIHSLEKKLSNIQSLEVNTSSSDIKKAAAAYIISLKGIVEAQNVYSNLADSICVNKAFSLDSINYEALKKAKLQRDLFDKLLNSQ